MSSVAGSDRFARSGGPAAVPSRRICVPLGGWLDTGRCPASTLGATTNASTAAALTNCLDVVINASGALRMVRSPHLAHFARRMAEAATEAPVEVGQVVEPDLVRDLGDAPRGEARTEQPRASARQPLLTHEFREGRALALEEHPHIARAQSMARSDLAEGQLVLEMRKDVILDRLQASRANAASVRDLLRLVTCTEHHRGEIVQMRDHHLRKARGAGGGIRVRSACISVQQPERR